MIKKIALVLILVIAFMLRFYQVGSLPALNADEAALAYNAYSLIQTGKDEHGHSWPLHFQSFNDYKPGLSVYLILPFVYLFGLNEWSVRVLPAFLSFLSVFIVYLLAKQLTINTAKKKDLLSLGWFPLFAVFLLAVSPWHIHFSRGVWEVNIATFFILLGVYFFFLIKKHFWFLLPSALFFILSLYTYHSARIITPLLVLGLSVFFYKELLDSLKKTLVVGIFGFVVCLPLIASLLSPAGLARAGGVGIWADIGPENRVNELRGNHEQVTILDKLMHNKPVIYSFLFLNNWASHYSGGFLFISGDDIQRNKVPETGMLHLIEIVFILFGIAMLLRNFKPRYAFILFWLLVAPIPAALTFQAPHALRAANMAVPFALLSGFGLNALCASFQKSAHKKKLVVLTLLVTSLFVARYIHMYFVHMSKEYPYSSQYGVKELVSYVQPIQGKYEKVVITDRYDQPYILFLFYLRSQENNPYSPSVFQSEHKLTDPDQFGFSTVRSFSNFQFESISIEEAKRKYPNSLIIGTEEEIPDEANIIKDIYGTNGFKYFEVVEN